MWTGRWVTLFVGSPGGTAGKPLACQCKRCKRCRFEPWVVKFTWSKKWQPTPESLPGEFHGQSSFVGSRVRHDCTHTHTHTHTNIIWVDQIDMDSILTLTVNRSRRLIIAENFSSLLQPTINFSQSYFTSSRCEYFQPLVTIKWESGISPAEIMGKMLSKKFVSYTFQMWRHFSNIKIV